ncbi:hypothetical protein GGF37_003999 [Kickxella alabastrina]|nr:hypothetical protein GGF37_003999 [Kickxella alabastrina]
MDIDRVERRDQLSVEEFVKEFLEPNLPVILGSHFTSTWAARREWVSDGKPNFPRLLELYAHAQVQVAECDTVYFSDQKRTTMSFSDFISKWHSNSKLYCKDWHFTQNSPFSAYRPLAHLSNDWLNLHCDSEAAGDDFRFCYLGGDATWTPFHEDVFRSYSWSANICGHKKWILVLPGQNHLFTDGLGNWVYNLMDYDKQKYPRLSELKTLEIMQSPGETVFVPAGWWHQVINVGDTISINHNWTNEHNLHRMYARLRADLDAVKYALRDVVDMDGFDEHVQVVLRADSGTDYCLFAGFLESVARIYLAQLQAVRDGGCDGGGRLAAFDRAYRSPDALRLALGHIANVLGMLEDDPDACRIKDLAVKISRLNEQIRQALM